MTQVAATLLDLPAVGALSGPSHAEEVARGIPTAVTFAGLSGMGDLIVTCTSGLSRNRSVGERIGRGEAVEKVLGNMRQAVEGAWNCASARALAHDVGAEVPIAEEVYRIVHEGRNPRDAVAALLARDVRPE